MPSSVFSVLFQSTLSVRRATDARETPAAANPFQSTLSVRRATSRPLPPIDDMAFQSTLSVRRATLQLSGEIRHADISIHALRKESDTALAASSSDTTDFNPRSP